MAKQKVLIVGAGVSGLTAALQLLEAGHDVTLFTKEPVDVFPNTSHNAYAMWVPVNFAPRLEDWANLGLAQYAADAADPASGVVLRSIFQLQTGERTDPWFATSYAGFRHAQPAEITDEYTDAHVLEGAPIIDPKVFLPWLRAKVLKAGGKIEQRVITELSTAPAEFTVVINCAGVGAGKLAGDTTTFPEKVQVLTIRNDGQVDSVFIDDAGPNQRACVVPQADYIKLGGVFTSHSDDLEPSAEATADILRRCNKMVPGLDATEADILSVVCALRPEREGWVPCVEKVALPDGRILINNYGHDGMGYLLAPGIAATIVGYCAE